MFNCPNYLNVNDSVTHVSILTEIQFVGKINNNNNNNDDNDEVGKQGSRPSFTHATTPPRTHRNKTPSLGKSGNARMCL